VGATRFVLNFNLQYPPYLVELERQKNLLQALLPAVQYEEREKKLAQRNAIKPCEGANCQMPVVGEKAS
jgi:hypothetical protein